jgi:hypothetical protein
MYDDFNWDDLEEEEAEKISSMNEKLSVSEDEDDDSLHVSLQWSDSIPMYTFKGKNLQQSLLDKLEGITRDSFSQDAAMWQAQINLLPSFDEGEIRKTIRSWNLKIPEKYIFDESEILSTYVRLMNYRSEIKDYIDLVYAHNELITQAGKSLEKIAIRLSPGPRHDKESNATSVVNDFSVASSQTKRILYYLEQTIKTIEFNAMLMGRMLQERQALSKINNTMINEGMNVNYNRSVQSPNIKHL